MLRAVFTNMGNGVIGSLTILTFKSNDRNSSSYSSALTATTFAGPACNCASAAASACNVTPLSAICLLNAGRKLSAMFLFTSNVSTVLHVLRTLSFRVDNYFQGFSDLCTFINVNMAYAYTACDHRDCRLLAAQFMQTSPPRGISMSMYLSIRSISLTSARSGLSIACTAPPVSRRISGRPESPLPLQR